MDTVRYNVSLSVCFFRYFCLNVYNGYNYGFHNKMEQASLVDYENTVTSIKKIATLGREPKDQFLRDFYSLDVSIDDPRVSHKHCTLVFDEWKKQFVLINHSKNGTVVNDISYVDEPCILHNEDRIILNKKNANTAFLFKTQLL
jgi:hypothetical protein